jgi:hypothetical protein
MGMEIAGVPKAVHGAFILGLPVDARPNGAGPIAAGDKWKGPFPECDPDTTVTRARAFCPTHSTIESVFQGEAFLY